MDYLETEEFDWEAEHDKLLELENKETNKTERKLDDVVIIIILPFWIFRSLKGTQYFFYLVF